ncbi:MAG: S1 RNA-binding domain-containing protein, partial [Candidatus Riflebacteria bacterium]|nr:S1 RNA-binding domain-containing protein [Candidatus Riflebacteria bacterium]
SGRLGQTFEARVTGVASYGLFVTLSRCLVEGMVPLRHLPADRWRMSDDGVALVGTLTRTAHRVGDAVEVRSVSADVLSRQITFEICGR